jgi:hypothetical protein
MAARRRGSPGKVDGLMSALTRSVIVAFALIATAVAVVAAPAFATPRLTSSTATLPFGRPDGGAVSPFITPIGNTTASSITINQNLGFRNGLSITATNHLNARFSITCFEFRGSGYIDRTHTQIRITRMDPLRCQDDLAALPVRVTLRTVSSTDPYFIHLRRDATRGVSWDGTLNIPAGSVIEVFEEFLRCGVHILPQSIDLRYTNINRTIEFLDPSVVFRSQDPTPGCFDPARGPMSWSNIPGRPIRIRPDTVNDVLRVTALSST